MANRLVLDCVLNAASDRHSVLGLAAGIRRLSSRGGLQADEGSAFMIAAAGFCLKRSESLSSKIEPRRGGCVVSPGRSVAESWVKRKIGPSRGAATRFLRTHFSPAK